MCNDPNKPLIRLVDDDPDQILALELLLRSEGWDTASYLCARAFFSSDAPSRPGCLILDVRMPEMTGLEVQAEMKRREYPLPIIFLTGHGDVEMAVHALLQGARDFLQKPVQPNRLLKAVARVVQEDLDQRSLFIDEEEWLRRWRLLTDRERDIIQHVLDGCLNKVIARKLQISERTVQAHRQAAYKKLLVHNVADLAPLTVLKERRGSL